jgi:soluble lytic murein transglycosylase
MGTKTVGTFPTFPDDRLRHRYIWRRMAKQLKETTGKWAIATGAGVVVLIAGIAVISLRFPGLFSNLPFLGSATPEESSIPPSPDLADNQDSAVLPLAAQPPGDRQAPLTAIANQPEPSFDRSRARYLLAVDALEQRNPEQTLTWLQDLEQDYELLAPHILYKRAKAHRALDQRAEALNVWRTLAETYPDSPIAAEALYAIGLTSTDTEYWDGAIAQFPSHPRTLDIAQARLQEEPGQVELLLLLARYGGHLEDYVAILNELAEDHAEALEPNDWEAIGFGYWENLVYARAGEAYAKATETPQNLYRAGRGAQLGDRREDAIRHYRRLYETFPDASDTAQGLIHLARLSNSPQNAIAYLDIVRQMFPDRAADALFYRAERLDELQSAASAAQARQSILTQFGTSDAAANLRWQQIEQRIKIGDASGAQPWAEQLVAQNPDSDHAPEALFWLGKWADEAGDRQTAQTAYEQILRDYPDSYYAWRAALGLGWDVGSFTTVRQKNLPIAAPPRYQTVLAGSPMLHELYWLGQDDDAWTLWQAEYRDRIQPSVDEQFTDGIMRLGVGDNLEGIFMLESLAWRDAPDEQDQYQALRRDVAFWQNRYPLLYKDLIQTWSSDRQLNPLLVISLMRQESRFEPEIESVAGALGLMQVLPETADWIASQTDIGEYTMTDPDDNIKLGTWYLDYTHREYNNNSLFAIASYNAGPGNIADWITRFDTSDPDLFVEQIPFPETKNYVETVFGNYWNYLRIYNPDLSRRLAEYSPEQAALVQGTERE